MPPKKRKRPSGSAAPAPKRRPRATGKKTPTTTPTTPSVSFSPDESPPDISNDQRSAKQHLQQLIAGVQPVPSSIIPSTPPPRATPRYGQNVDKRVDKLPGDKKKMAHIYLGLSILLQNPLHRFGVPLTRLRDRLEELTGVTLTSDRLWQVHSLSEGGFDVHVGPSELIVVGRERMNPSNIRIAFLDRLEAANLINLPTKPPPGTQPKPLPRSTGPSTALLREYQTLLPTNTDVPLKEINLPKKLSFLSEGKREQIQRAATIAARKEEMAPGLQGLYTLRQLQEVVDNLVVGLRRWRSPEVDWSVVVDWLTATVPSRPPRGEVIAALEYLVDLAPDLYEKGRRPAAVDEEGDQRTLKVLDMTCSRSRSVLVERLEKERKKLGQEGVLRTPSVECNK